MMIQNAVVRARLYFAAALFACAVASSTPAAATITITAPTASVLVTGASITVAWTGGPANPASYYVGLEPGALTSLAPYAISQGTGNPGQITSTVPSAPCGSSYYLVVVVNAPTASDPNAGEYTYRGPITIDCPPALALLQPYNGTITTHGATLPIVWTANNAASSISKLVYVDNATAAQTVISTTVSNTAAYNWTYNWVVPNSLPCGRWFYASLYYTQGGVAASTNSGRFMVECPVVPAAGSLTVTKTVVNDTGKTLTSGLYSVSVNCGHQGPSKTMSLADGSSDSLSGIPLGLTCFIAENSAPQPPPGCVWQTTYPQGQSVKIGQAGYRLDVLNTLVCRGKGDNNDNNSGDNTDDNGKGKSAGLLVAKRVDGDDYPGTPGPFTVQVTCVAGGPNFTAVLDASNGYQKVYIVPQGKICTVHEDVPPVPKDVPRGCHWETSYPTGDKTKIREGRNVLAVRNTWVCPSKTDDGGKDDNGKDDNGKDKDKDKDKDNGKDTGSDDKGRQTDLSIMKTAPGRDWPVGSAGVFNLIVTNNGGALNSPVSIAVSDNLPSNLTFVAAAGTGWMCNTSVPVVCTYAGSVAAGQTLPAIVITAIARQEGTFENCARVALQGAHDSNPSDNSACTSFTVGRARAEKGNVRAPQGPDLGIVKRVTAGRWLPMGQGTFELTVSNYGAALERSAVVEVRDTLPAGLNLMSVAPGSSAWRCSQSGPELRCSFTGSVLMGALPTIRVTAVAIRAGAFRNCADVHLSGASETLLANNSSCVTIRVGLDAEPERVAPPPLIVPPAEKKKTPACVPGPVPCP